MIYCFNFNYYYHHTVTIRLFVNLAQNWAGEAKYWGGEAQYRR
jgi:hypothetical protein